LFNCASCHPHFFIFFFIFFPFSAEENYQKSEILWRGMIGVEPFISVLETHFELLQG
jgi:hypothetical protein